MKTLNPEIKSITFKVVVDLPEVDGKTIHPTENSIDSLRERLNNGEIEDITFVDSGSSWGTFGVEVEVDSPALIEPKTKELYSLINRILRAEKPEPPAPPRKKDTNDCIFSEKGIHGLESASLFRKVYGMDGRQFDTIQIRGNCLEKIAKNLRDEEHPLLKELSNALPFSYGILQHSLSVTFAEGTKIDYVKFKETLEILMNHTYYFKKNS